MSSFDIEILFTNIHLEETTKMCANQLFKNPDIVPVLKKSESKDLPDLATKD